eukprot:TRINITY_DN10542_c2_g1_i1.p1 TRINITY_DN10542_c2_g1~~TRINITY_DN10542_c2_g1_i1.p1  ORF type:complete len:3412 (-),score=718.22 TRINITY_DN10542_c2_g1_i1:80-9991(-)
MGRLTAYTLYLADDAAGAGRRQVEDPVPTGTNEMLMPDNFALRSSSHLVIYTRSSLLEQTTPVPFALVDEFATVSNIGFFDYDLDRGELLGPLEFSEPKDVSEVVRYIVYMAENATGAGRLFYENVTEGFNATMVRPDTPLKKYTHFCVYTQSALFEQTTPAAFQIVDNDASVSDVFFEDVDLDDLDVGGFVTWNEPTNMAGVLGYEAYLAQSYAGSERSQVGDDFALQAGTTKVMVDANQPIRFYTHLVVYTRSELVEQTTPVADGFVDNLARVRNVTFVDGDLDPLDIGGDVKWVAPENTSHVEEYILYLASSIAGAQRLSVDASLPGTDQILVPLNTPLSNHTHAVVYTRSFLLESTTPDGVEIKDNLAVITDVTFQDKDLDRTEAGGRLYWKEPSDTKLVEGYKLYLSRSEEGEGRKVFVPDFFTPGTSHYDVPEDSPLGPNTHWALYVNAVPLIDGYGFVESTTPASLYIDDTDSSVSALNFTELDLDRFEIGGPVTWSEPVNVKHVTHYLIYLTDSNASSHDMAKPVLNETVGTSQTLISADTPLADHMKVLVYAASSWFVQTTPTVFDFVDTIASVSALEFPDDDLDPGEVGGFVTWKEPFDMRYVDAYDVYAADNTLGANRTYRDAAPAGAEAFAVPDNTPTFSNVVVYTRSALTEQTTPIGRTILQQDLYLSSTQFVDEDLDPEQVYGFVTWSVPEGLNSDRLTNFDVYLARCDDPSQDIMVNGILCPSLHRVFLISAPPSANQTLLPSDTDANNLNNILVYARSKFFEQTTPGVGLVSDCVAEVPEVRFIDKDLDEGDIGGSTITWDPPLSNEERVMTYRVYLAGSALGAGRSLVGSDVLRGKHDQYLTLDTPLLLEAANFTPVMRTHIVVYTRSILAEQSKPTALAISDTISIVGNVEFPDDDLDELEVAGFVTWASPADTRFVTYYRAFMALDEAGNGRSVLGTVPVGTTVVAVPENLPVFSSGPSSDKWTHVIVYSESDLAEHTTPAILPLYDSNGAVLSLEFPDRDLDPGEIGGRVEWTEPGDTRRILGYNVYLTPSQPSKAGAFVLPLVPVGQSSAPVAPEMPVGGLQYALVFSRSALAEQTTPEVVPIVDIEVDVFNVTYVGYDLDAFHLGGDVFWIPQEDVYTTTKYNVYLRDPREVGRGEYLGYVPVGTNLFTLPMDYVRNINQTEFAIFAASDTAEQTHHAGRGSLRDRSAPVADIDFVDYDLDPHELRGTVTWTVTPSEYHRMKVVRYAIYVCSRDLYEPDMFDRSFVGYAEGKDTSSYFVPPNTPIPPELRHDVRLCVFACSERGEATYPTDTNVTDVDGHIAFEPYTDQDLDATEIAGIVTWDTSKPLETFATHYTLYFVDGQLVPGRGTWTLICAEAPDPCCDGHATVTAIGAGTDTACSLPVGVSALRLEPGTAHHTYIVAYSRSWVEPELTTVPVVLNVRDVDGSAVGVAFIDDDLDHGQIGGYVRWLPPTLPEDAALVTKYHVFLTGGPLLSDPRKRPLCLDTVNVDGVDPARISCDVLPSADQHAFVPLETDVDVETSHVIVISVSAFAGEQSKLSASALATDLDASPGRGSLKLLDLDFDVDEIGGYATWQPPPLAAAVRVTQWEVYVSLGYMQFSAQRPLEILGTSPGASSQFLVDAATAFRPYLYVYARSALALQSRPGAVLNVSDVIVQLYDVRFLDHDLDPHEVGGSLAWKIPDGAPHVAHTSVYFSVDAEWSDRLTQSEKLGQTEDNSEVFLVPADSQVKHFEYFVLAAASVVEEQTINFANFSFRDMNGSVDNISFVDEDLDYMELGGRITWEDAADALEGAPIEEYDIVLGTEFNKIVVSTVDFGILAYDMPPETPSPTDKQTYVFIRAANSFHRQSHPSGLLVQDSDGLVLNLGFADEEQDMRVIGGNVYWKAPNVVDLIKTYRIVLDPGSGYARMDINSSVPGRAVGALVPMETKLTKPVPYKILVYARSALAEQTTPAAVKIAEMQVRFLDLFLGEGYVAGDLQWSRPLYYVEDVAKYWIFLADGRAKEQKVLMPPQLATDGAATEKVYLEKGTFLDGRTHFLIVAVETVDDEEVMMSGSLFKVVDATGGIFEDVDIDPGEIGGPLVWAKPLEMLTPSHFAVLMAEHASGKGDVKELAILPTHEVSVGGGVYEWLIPFHTTGTGSYRFIFVYAADNEYYNVSAMPEVVITFSDVGAVACCTHFQDYDLDVGFIGGRVSWTAPDQGLLYVSGYNLYTAADASGTDRRLIGSQPLGTNYIIMPRGTAVAGYLHLVTVAASEKYPQESSPALSAVEDFQGNVMEVFLTDTDLSGGEIGGPVRWRVPEVYHKVTYDVVLYYAVYLGGNPGTKMAPLGLVPVTASQGASSGVATAFELQVPKNVPVAGFTRLLVQGASYLGAQTIPSQGTLLDVPGAPRNLQLEDVDPYVGAFAGEVRWEQPTSSGASCLQATPEACAAARVPPIESYAVFLTQSSKGREPRTLLGEAPFGTTKLTIQIDTGMEDGDNPAQYYLAVFSKTAGGLQDPPALLMLNDLATSLREGHLGAPYTENVMFEDQDIDIGYVGGVVTWSVADHGKADTEVDIKFDEFKLFFGVDPLGLSEPKMELDMSGQIAAEDTRYNIPFGIPRFAPNGKRFTHILLYTGLGGTLHTPPMAIPLIDGYALVSQLRFLDVECATRADSSEALIQGTARWSGGGSLIPEAYSVYSSEDDGTGPNSVKTLLATVKPGTDFLQIPSTPKGGIAYILVYAEGKQGPQRRPAAVPIQDCGPSTATGLRFEDFDVDRGEIAGRLSWTRPESLNEITGIAVYVSSGQGGSVMVQVSPNLVPGTTTFVIPDSTPLLYSSHGAAPFLMVCTKLGDAVRTRAPVHIEDYVATITASSFVPAAEPEPGIFAGVASWDPPADTSRLAAYEAYLAGDASGVGKFLVGQADVGTNHVKIMQDLAATVGMSSLLVLTRSVAGYLQSHVLTASREAGEEAAEMEAAAIAGMGDGLANTELAAAAAATETVQLEPDPIGLCDTSGKSALFSEVIFGGARRIVAGGCPNHYAACQDDSLEYCDGVATSARHAPELFELPAAPRLKAPSQAVSLRCEKGALAVMLNGVPLYGRNNGKDTCLDQVPDDSVFFDACGGYADMATGLYHYSAPPACLNAQRTAAGGDVVMTGHSPQLGWSLDGFPVYGELGPGGIPMVPCAELPHGGVGSMCLDKCLGYEGELPDVDGYRYRYYVRGPFGSATCATEAITNGAGECRGKCCVDAVPSTVYGPNALPCRRGCTWPEIQNGACTGEDGMASGSTAKPSEIATEPSHLVLS